MADAPPRQGWPLPVKLFLALVVLAFVWSPFLAMLVRLSNVNPSLAPDRAPSGAAPRPAATPASPAPAP